VFDSLIGFDLLTFPSRRHGPMSSPAVADVTPKLRSTTMSDQVAISMDTAIVGMRVVITIHLAENPFSKQGVLAAQICLTSVSLVFRALGAVTRNFFPWPWNLLTLCFVHVADPSRYYVQTSAAVVMPLTQNGIVGEVDLADRHAKQGRHDLKIFL